MSGLRKISESEQTNDSLTKLKEMDLIVQKDNSVYMIN